MRIEDGYGIFDVNIVGTFTNQTYLGTFKVKCLLSPMEQIKADKLYRDILGSNAHLTSNHVASLAYAASQLHIRIVEHPAFWEGESIGGSHIVDENVILDVIDKAIEAQAVFVEDKKKELIERQEVLANLIRNKKIVPEDSEEEAPITSSESEEENETLGEENV